MLVSILLPALILIYVLLKLFFYDEKDKYLFKLKAEPRLPFIGHAHVIGTNSRAIYDSLFRMWKNLDNDTFRIDLGHNKFVILSTPEAIETILSSSQNLDKQNETYQHLLPWLGTGLLISSGSKWHSRRKILTPAFHFKILEPYVDIFQIEARTLVKKLTDKEDQDINVHPLISSCALSAICETAMGIQIQAQETCSPYVSAIEEICRIVHLKMFSVWKKYDFLFNNTSDGKAFKECLNIIHSQTSSVIENRRKENEQNGAVIEKEPNSVEEIGSKKRLAFLDILLMSKDADGKPFTDEAIKEEVNTFMFEGHDTTTSSLSYTIYLLSQHPEIQEKLYEEQMLIFGNCYDKPATYRELQEMKYLERVIKESLRRYPAVPLFGRSLNEAVTLPDGSLLPKGALVTIAPMLLHMNAKLYPDPEKFDPDRFAPENDKRHPYAYIPFSAGPRNCIGQKFVMLEMKSVLSTIVRQLHIMPAPGFEPRPAAEVTLKSDNGIVVRFKRRITL